jgi:CDP-diacylglycerol--glycerol-3-phosphate 3-phosphatidyltransferase
MQFSVYQLKPKFQQLLQPLLQRLAQWGVTPNQLTLVTTASMFAYAACLAYQPQRLWLWASLPFVFLVRMALNALDGMLANATGQKTRLGAMLNEVCDQASDAALYLPFALAPGVHAGLAVAMVVLTMLCECVGLSALAAGSARRFDGPMGKSDRAVAMGLLAVLLAAGAGALWLNGLLVVVLLLLVWTMRNRLRNALRA